jgi:aspartyl-tRNA(Asn)/glutamyl-tRNA(Gln) amidotransferase subunit C
MRKTLTPRAPKKPSCGCAKLVLSSAKVADSELPRLAGELNVILNFVEQLNEVNVDNVEPLTSVVKAQMKMRADVVTDGHYAKAIIQNAAASEDDFFMVPKVVE